MNPFVDRRDGNSDQSTPSGKVGVGEERSFDGQSGKIGWALLWLLGIPLPVLIVIYLIWGR